MVQRRSTDIPKSSTCVPPNRLILAWRLIGTGGSPQRGDRWHPSHAHQRRPRSSIRDEPHRTVPPHQVLSVDFPLADADPRARLLLSRMLTGPSKPRFVIVGSGAHKMLQGEFPWDDPNGNTSYPATKVLNHLFAPALVRKSAGKVDAFSLSPGCGCRVGD